MPALSDLANRRLADYKSGSANGRERRDRCGRISAASRLLSFAAAPSSKRSRRAERARAPFWCIWTASPNRRRPATPGPVNARPAAAFDSARRCGSLLLSRARSARSGGRREHRCWRLALPPRALDEVVAPADDALDFGARRSRRPGRCGPYGPTRSPAFAGIMGARRSWTVSMISVLSMPRRYTEVTPRSACPNWR